MQLVNRQDIKTFTIMGVVILIGAVLVMLPKSGPVTAQSNPTTFEECLEIYPEHYCLDLFPPTATPTPAPPTNTPTPTATSTPRPNPTTFEECLEIYPEHYCLDLFPPTATPTPAPPTNTPTPTATPTPRPNPTTFEECLEIYPEHYCLQLFTPTPVPPTPTNTPTPSNPNTFEECLEIYPEHYCLELFPPTATPVPHTPTTVPDTPTPSNPNTFEECLEIYPEHYCLQLFTPTPVPDTPTPVPDTPTPVPDTPTPIPDTPTNTPVNTPTPSNPNTFEECLEIYPEHYCRELFPPTPTNTPTPLPLAPAPNVIEVRWRDLDIMQVAFHDMPDQAVTLFRVRYKRSSETDYVLARIIRSQNNRQILTAAIEPLHGCKEPFDFEVAAIGDGTKYRHGPGHVSTDSGSLPCPAYHGMQRDHVVGWKITDLPSANVLGLDLPQKVEDPDKVFRKGAISGSSNWNGKGGIISTCESPCDANKDYWVEVIADYDNNCPSGSYGCIQVHLKETPDDHDIPHFTAQKLWIRHKGKDRNGYTVYFTNTWSKRNTWVPGEENESKYRYLNRTMTHEFGHAVGIKDLLYHEDFGRFLSVMGLSLESTRTPTSHDVKQIKAIYRGHTAHK